MNHACTVLSFVTNFQLETKSTQWEDPRLQAKNKPTHVGKTNKVKKLYCYFLSIFIAENAVFTGLQAKICKLLSKTQSLGNNDNNSLIRIDIL